MATKPTTEIRWASETGANITTPDTTRFDLGWQYEDVPPAGWQNYMMNSHYLWIKYLVERDDNKTSDDVANASTVSGATVTDALDSLSFKEWSGTIVPSDPTGSLPVGDNEGAWYVSRYGNTHTLTIKPKIEYIEGADISSTFSFAMSLLPTEIRPSTDTHWGTANYHLTPVSEGDSYRSTPFRLFPNLQSETIVEIQTKQYTAAMKLYSISLSWQASDV